MGGAWEEGGARTWGRWELASRTSQVLPPALQSREATEGGRRTSTRPHPGQDRPPGTLGPASLDDFHETCNPGALASFCLRSWELLWKRKKRKQNKTTLRFAVKSQSEPWRARVEGGRGAFGRGEGVSDGEEGRSSFIHLRTPAHTHILSPESPQCPRRERTRHGLAPGAHLGAAAPASQQSHQLRRVRSRQGSGTSAPSAPPLCGPTPLPPSHHPFPGCRGSGVITCLKTLSGLTLT